MATAEVVCSTRWRRAASCGQARMQSSSGAPQRLLARAWRRGPRALCRALVVPAALQRRMHPLPCCSISLSAASRSGGTDRAWTHCTGPASRRRCCASSCEGKWRRCARSWACSRARSPPVPQAWSPRQWRTSQLTPPPRMTLTCGWDLGRAPSCPQMGTCSALAARLWTCPMVHSARHARARSSCSRLTVHAMWRYRRYLRVSLYPQAWRPTHRRRRRAWGSLWLRAVR
mmetsp:Transcript_23419/g.60242  ORF Transcript_23419/g.60242 Transcript_23419/m.60242 type:complete len:230 (-) Transcript_23419:2027-2716(-)